MMSKAVQELLRGIPESLHPVAIDMYCKIFENMEKIPKDLQDKLRFSKNDEDQMRLSEMLTEGLNQVERDLFILLIAQKIMNVNFFTL